MTGKSFNSGRKALEDAGFKLVEVTDTGRKVFVNVTTGAKVAFDSGKALTPFQKNHWHISTSRGTALVVRGKSFRQGNTLGIYLPVDSMTYRRAFKEIDASRRWKKFVTDRASLFDAIGVPLFLQENKERFDHWLMHGHHPEDLSRFSSYNLNFQARKSLLDLVNAYFEAGFKDPGIMILSNQELATLSSRPPFAGHIHSPNPELNSQNQKRSKRAR